MQIERRDDRHIGPDQLAHLGDQRTLAVRPMLQRHRAVQAEEHAIHRQCLANTVQYLGAEGLVRLARDPPARHRVRVERRDQLDPLRLGLGDDAAVDRAGSRQAQDAFAALDPARSLAEIGQGGRLPLEGVRFLGDPPGRDSDRHRVPPWGDRRKSSVVSRRLRELRSMPIAYRIAILGGSGIGGSRCSTYLDRNITIRIYSPLW